MAENWQEWISFRLDWTRRCLLWEWWWDDDDSDNTSNKDMCGYHSIKRIMFGFATKESLIMRQMFYKNLVKYLQWSGDWKKYDHYDTVAVYRMVKSFWRSCQASRSPILRHHHPLTWKDKHEKGWLFKSKFFNHQHLTFNIVTFLPSEFLTKSRNNPTKLQVTCPSWLWLCASIMQSIL